MNGEPRSFVSLLVWRGCALAAACLCCSSCASPLATSAKQEDLNAFQAKLRSAEQPISDREVLEVAQAIAERELLSMPSDTAVSRVTELEACIPKLEATLQQLSERRDTVGALAVQVLLDERLWKGDRDALVEQHAASPSPEWRAVAARAAVPSKHAEYRREAFLDGDLRVRRAALRAARDARAKEDADSLLEAARVDPDSVARRFALEALSAIADAQTLARLRDIWPYADDLVRQELVFAWGRKGAFANGGKGQLEWVLATQSGLPRLAAAVVLYQRVTQDTTDNYTRAIAEGALVRGFTDGTADEQQFVARYAPRTMLLVQTFAEALRSDNEQAAVSAAAVLVRSPKWRGAANERLTALLASKTPRIAEQAHEVLARERAPHVKQGLLKSLGAREPSTRVAAAVQLLRYHRAGERGLGVERLLADPEASVRTTVACQVIEQLGD